MTWFRVFRRGNLGETTAVAWLDLRLVACVVLYGTQQGSAWELAVETLHGQHWWLEERFSAEHHATQWVNTVLLPAIEKARTEDGDPWAS